MKYCQGPMCHTHKTKDRIRGSKGDKHYETRKRSSFYYGKGNFCDQRCMYDWIDKHIEHGLDHFGRLHEPKRTGCDSGWHKICDWNSTYNGGTPRHYFVNDLLGERRPITQEQYNNTAIDNPTHLD